MNEKRSGKSDSGILDEHEDQLAQLSSVDPDELRDQLIRSYSEFEQTFRKDYAILWWSTLVSPVALTGLILLVIGFIWGFDLSGRFLLAAFVTFILLGRFVILGGNEAGEVEGWMQNFNLEPLQLFGMVTVMDCITALFVTFHMGFLFRVPWLGPKISALVWDGKFLMEKQPWIRRVAFFGLVVFVIYPSSTTGSIGGSIFGRLLGLGRGMTVCGVLVGSLIGNGIMLYFAEWINEHIGSDSIWLKVVGIALIVIVIAVLEWRYQKVKKKYVTNKAKSVESEAS